MEVPALCIRLSISVLLLMVRVDQHFADAAFPRIVPDRLQFFECETFSVRCEETDAFTEWRVMRKLIKINTTHSSNWNTSEPSAYIQIPFEKHSGEYWCENEEGDRSNTLNISVTAGSVILESPARPVMEGYDVTLHCRNKKTESQRTAEFYKDGSHLRTLYNSSLIIQNVSKSDEGLYKCSLSGAGESPESRLLVVTQTPEDRSNEGEIHPVLIPSLDLLKLLWVVVTALLVDLLLLMMGVRLCRKHKEPKVSTGDMKPCLLDDIYSQVSYRPLTSH